MIIPIFRETNLHTILCLFSGVGILLVEIIQATGSDTTSEKCRSVLCEKTRLLSLRSSITQFIHLSQFRGIIETIQLFGDRWIQLGQIIYLPEFRNIIESIQLFKHFWV